MSAKHNPAGNEKRLQNPLKGGKFKQFNLLLQYPKTFQRPGSPNEVFLLLKNNTHRRVEGWLTLTPPRNWVIEPGTRLMIGARPEGTIVAEFYLSLPDLPGPGPHLLHTEVTSGDHLLAEAEFDLQAGILFSVKE